MPALTALPAWALLGAKADSAVISNAVRFVLSTQKPDGGFYTIKPGRTGGSLSTYNTAVCLSMLHYSGMAPIRSILDGRTFLANNQLTGDDEMAGGFGYGQQNARRRYADLSNTAYALSAMRLTEGVEDVRPAGEKRVDVNWDKALKFVERLQKVEGEDKGGAAYNERTPQAGSETNRAGKVQLKAYGSMSYGALLSMCSANLTKGDPRVRMSLEYCTKYWNVDENPGMGKQGLFYYYDILSRALSAAEVSALSAVDGKVILWKKELAEKLLALQNSDGSWNNDNNRFWEDNPVLCTSFAMIALNLCR